MPIPLAYARFPKNKKETQCEKRALAHQPRIFLVIECAAAPSGQGQESEGQVFLNEIPVYICGIKACGALVVLVGDAGISLAQQSAGKVRKAGQFYRSG
jgi:hypothetical protein